MKHQLTARIVLASLACAPMLASAPLTAAVQAPGARVSPRMPRLEAPIKAVSIERRQAVLRAAGVIAPSPPPQPGAVISLTVLSPASDKGYLDFITPDEVLAQPDWGPYAFFSRTAARPDSKVVVYWKGMPGALYLADCTVHSSLPTLSVNGETLNVGGEHVLFVLKESSGAGTAGYSSFEIKTTQGQAFAYRGCEISPA
ncbi:hypothetical protein [Novosphingobium lentum]|uniref:hypothetical protein n=1 Tax=Novosphingobium lentum TaxID=145287 RepID=UPI000829A649|nr:hypothetical protein [Novosphingobium lentum]